jgi:hypothetical protein
MVKSKVNAANETPEAVTGGQFQQDTVREGV